MSAKRWYSELVDQLMTERKVSVGAVARKAGVDRMTVQRLRTGSPYVSVESLEKILRALSHELEAIPLPEVEPLPVRDERCVTNGRDAKRPRQPRAVLPGDPESYCYGCGKEGSMVNVHSHWHCKLCGYIEPCCND